MNADSSESSGGNHLRNLRMICVSSVFICGYAGRMSKKSAAIAALIEGLRGRELDAHYLGYFECFNRQLYFEAHDVLEELWLTDRNGPNGAFYKGLIQLAGALDQSLDRKSTRLNSSHG